MVDSDSPSGIRPRRAIGRSSMAISAVCLLEFAIALTLIFQLWPSVSSIVGNSATIRPDPATLLFVGEWRPTVDSVYLALVALFSTTGACVHSLTSLATYIGNGTFRPRWTLWYLVRVPIGVAIALILYALLRGGLLSAGSPAGVINPYAVAGTSALAGLFSKQATDKLEEVFTTLFKSSHGDKERLDKAKGSASNEF